MYQIYLLCISCAFLSVDCNEPVVGNDTEKTPTLLAVPFETEPTEDSFVSPKASSSIGEDYIIEGTNSSDKCGAAG